MTRGSLTDAINTREIVNLVARPDKTAGCREGLPVGGAELGRITGMGAHVHLQDSGLGEGLAAGRV